MSKRFSLWQVPQIPVLLVWCKTSLLMLAASIKQTRKILTKALSKTLMRWVNHSRRTR